MNGQRGLLSITAGVVLASCAYGYDWGTNPGTGEPNNPYQISTAEQLLSIHWDPSLPDPNLLNKSYLLTNDIDLAGYPFTTAVIAADENLASGYQGLGFCGVFDGQHYRIQNLTMTHPGQHEITWACLDILVQIVPSAIWAWKMFPSLVQEVLSAACAGEIPEGL